MSKDKPKKKKVKDPGYRIFFLRSASKFPVACVASTVAKSPLGDVVLFGISTHNPADVFDKEEARRVALERITYSAHVPYGLGAKKTIIAAIAKSIAVPTRTRKAAQHWIEEHTRPEGV